MTYFVCTQLENPCQVAHQVAVTEVTVQDLAALGITPQSITQSVALGFGLVFAIAITGYVLGLVLKLIRSI